MNDGPQGFRGPPGTSTQFPSGLTVATAWDRGIMQLYGETMGEEFRGKGCDVQFGPGVNLNRVPWGGRAFEYLSGEDPLLGHELAYSVVSGIQSKGVIANYKHFFLNNQENNRHFVSNNCDERTAVELYLQPYIGGVKAGVLSAMCANSRVNQSYSCESSWAIQSLLRGVAEFSGFMLSDYQGTRSTVAAANHGLDIQMPGCERPDAKHPLICDSDKVRPNYFGEPLLQAVRNGSVSEATIDAKVTRILRAMIVSGAMDRPRNPSNTSATNVTSPEHNRVAFLLAMRSAVLLKDTHSVLPLSSSSKSLRVAVIGKAASAGAITGGGGSGSVVPAYTSTVLSAMQEKLPGNGDSFKCTYENNTDYLQPNSKHTDVDSAEACCAACSLHDGCIAFTYMENFQATPSSPATNRCWFKPSLDGKRANHKTVSGTCTRKRVPRVTYADGTDVDQAVALAKDADVAVVVLASTSREGIDRTTLTLEQSDVAAAVGAAQRSTIVIVAAPGQFLTKPWEGNVSTLVVVGMSGQEQGRAVTEVLFYGPDAHAAGCPCGRLPYTLPNVENETQFPESAYPGINNETFYVEKLEIGYRWYTAHGVKPAYAFGAGLTYTTFEFSNFRVSTPGGGRPPSAAVVEVHNTGERSGRAVGQLYIKYPDASGEPPVQLRGFDSEVIEPGKSAFVSFRLYPQAFSIWDVESHQWVLQHGTFLLSVGTASDNLGLHVAVQVSA